uniref:Uncharacterized protein n=1 Tax=Molossus molossus TaxID=27622 RepID=A0A7J8C949_MOLMO|nr:hypothetical protein HJG59_009970 [Molossus molossus]
MWSAQHHEGQGSCRGIGVISTDQASCCGVPPSFFSGPSIPFKAGVPPFCRRINRLGEVKKQSVDLKPRLSPASVAHWLSVDPCTKRSLVRFSVKAHAQVVGLIPRGGHAGGSQSMFSLIDVFISLPLPSSLSKINF